MIKEAVLLFGLLSIPTVGSEMVLDSNQSERIRQNLIITLEKVKKFKQEKNNQIRQLNEELKSFQEKFLKYRIQKEREIKRLRRELRRSKKELAETKEALNGECETLVWTTAEPLSTLENVSVSGTVQSSTPLPVVSESPWVEVVVDDGMNLYDLALEYYGDRSAYQEIYALNQPKIGTELTLKEGLSLRLPITKDFKKSLSLQEK